MKRNLPFNSLSNLCRITLLLTAPLSLQAFGRWTLALPCSKLFPSASSHGHRSPSEDFGLDFADFDIYKDSIIISNSNSPNTAKIYKWNSDGLHLLYRMNEDAADGPGITVQQSSPGSANPEQVFSARVLPDNILTLRDGTILIRDQDSGEFLRLRPDAPAEGIGALLIDAEHAQGEAVADYTSEDPSDDAATIELQDGSILFTSAADIPGIYRIQNGVVHNANAEFGIEAADICPTGLAQLADGKILVADSNNQCIWAFQDGIRTRYVGFAEDGPAAFLLPGQKYNTLHDNHAHSGYWGGGSFVPMKLTRMPDHSVLVLNNRHQILRITENGIVHFAGQQLNGLELPSDPTGPGPISGFNARNIKALPDAAVLVSCKEGVGLISPADTLQATLVHWVNEGIGAINRRDRAAYKKSHDQLSALLKPAQNRLRAVNKMTHAEYRLHPPDVAPGAAIIPDILKIIEAFAENNAGERLRAWVARAELDSYLAEQLKAHTAARSSSSSSSSPQKIQNKRSIPTPPSSSPSSRSEDGDRQTKRAKHTEADVPKRAF